MKGTVLVVDDDRQIQEFVTRALEDEEYRVLQAVDAASLNVARATHPDVILLDIMMPEMDGAEVSRHLRGDEATEHIPIVAMSALTPGLAPPHLLVDDWLSKPFDLDELYRVVERWVI